MNDWLIEILIYDTWFISTDKLINKFLLNEVEEKRGGKCVTKTVNHGTDEIAILDHQGFLCPKVHEVAEQA